MYRDHFSFVWRSAKRLGIAEVDLPDAVHDIFLVIFERIHTFDSDRSLRSWIFGIVRNSVFNRNRKEFNRARISRALIASEPPRQAPDTPEGQFLETERAQLVRRFIMNLPEKQRSILLLVDLEGESLRDAARALDTNRDTAATRLRAAREKLKREIASHERIKHEQVTTVQRHLWLTGIDHEQA